MSEWHEYVKNWSALSPEQQRGEWAKLTPDQQQAFEAARLELGRSFQAPSSSAPVKKRRMLPWVLGCGCFGVLAFAFLLTVVIKAGGGLSQLEKEGAVVMEKKELEDARETAAQSFALDAEQLVSAYEANEVAADRTYRGRTITVSGRIRDIAKDLGDNMYVTLEGPGDSFRAVQCTFSARHEGTLAELSQGEYVRLVGHCEGLMANVQLEDCRLVK